MTKDDLPEVISMERQVFGPEAWSSGDFEEALRQPFDYPLVLREEALADCPDMTMPLAGYCLLRILPPEGEILNICVAEKLRGQGLGSLMMLKMEELCRREGVSQVFLEVRRSNLRAQILYGNFGFREIAVRKHYYQDPEEDALIMAAEIDEKEIEDA